MATFVVGCRSRVIAVTIANESGGNIRAVEVTFPGGSYGISSLAAGTLHHNRIKPFASGELRVAYQDASGKEHTAVGPRLMKDEESAMRVVIERDRVRFGSP